MLHTIIAFGVAKFEAEDFIEEFPAMRRREIPVLPSLPDPGRQRDLQELQEFFQNIARDMVRPNFK